MMWVLIFLKSRNQRTQMLPFLEEQAGCGTEMGCSVLHCHHWLTLNMRGKREDYVFLVLFVASLEWNSQGKVQEIW